ncbi:hypothetical protein HYPSUDRAFT_200480 [Hypholoma sublateritium FD-334 SS-4]|uniref:Uncharacterized protein n=1 Tax=Hypholoma sublateritium (strain FD-334 SS-4) TaxID=945553 RepID=A0A0D2P7J1_HYPSF|nr:hypothetical protein HYPSUDRAFT_200480 [Hypholoma sublateritium FD-334 SS-4]
MADAAAKNRFDSFKLGLGLPSSGPIGAPRHAHSRSHSRNLSISSFSKSTTVNDSASPTFPSPIPSPTSPNLVPSTKRNSHHRRRSSVSTRHESAEMMGVALPDLPPSTSDDNINLGEKDSIRRRALWALEGKPDLAFSKVEIPNISTADMDKMLFDLSSKPPVAPSYGNALNSMMGSKRDSFKLLGPSSSAKDQLHTLVEEEEEEDESPEISKEEPASSIKENVPPTPVLALTKATPSKPRPSNLNLRPLSLTPENLQTAPGLPSPSPSPNPRTGLRSLSLAPIDDTTASTTVKQSRRASLVISPPPSRRPVLNLALEQLENTFNTCDDDSKPTRRSSISYKRSSHGSMTTNIVGLPTPEMTPTFGRRYSGSDRESISSLGLVANTTADDDFFPAPPTQTRPLSASEQHFLFKSHNALLARITDLERALSMRRRESGGAFSAAGSSSRPMSAASNRSSLSDRDGSNRTHSPSPSEPSDEMLRLVADLKAERDELKRDADGWRTRVGDMEAQLSVLAKRVENERRDAWVARSRGGLLEVEKSVLVKKATALEEAQALRAKEHATATAAWEVERALLVEKEAKAVLRAAELEAQLERVRDELEAERAASKAPMSDPQATPVPPARATVHGLGLSSVDSESSATDIDSSDDGFRNPFAFKISGSDSYSEEDTYGSEDEEEDALAGYEDEDDADTDMSLQSSSSYGSEEDLPHRMERAASPTTPRPNQVFTPPRPAHERRATLSKAWKFPFGGAPRAAEPEPEVEDEEDRFFGCLDDGEGDGMREVPSSPSAYSYEKSKGLFASGFKLAPSNDNASFFMPGIGFPAEESEEESALSVVDEEEEADEEDRLSAPADDDDMFGEDIGGIRIIFTPPQEEEVPEERKQIQLCSPTKRTSPPPMLPALDFGFGQEDEDTEDDSMDGIPFNFGRALAEERQPSPSPLPVRAAAIPVPTMMMTPPSSLPRASSPAVTVSQRPASPSMIPRPASPSVSSIPRLAKAASATVGTPIKSPPGRAATLPMSPTASFITPPPKRAGSLMSFIPTPVASPSPMRIASGGAPRPKVTIAPSTFIRQPPARKAVPPVSISKTLTNVSPSTARYASSSSPSTAAPSFYTLFDVASSAGSGAAVHAHACMPSVDLTQDGLGATSISAMVTSPFKSLTSLIPRAWSAPAIPVRGEEEDGASPRRTGGSRARLPWAALSACLAAAATARLCPSEPPLSPKLLLAIILHLLAIAAAHTYRWTCLDCTIFPLMTLHPYTSHLTHPHLSMPSMPHRPPPPLRVAQRLCAPHHPYVPSPLIDFLPPCAPPIQCLSSVASVLFFSPLYPHYTYIRVAA